MLNSAFNAGGLGNPTQVNLVKVGVPLEGVPPFLETTLPFLRLDFLPGN